MNRFSQLARAFTFLSLFCIAPFSMASDRTETENDNTRLRQLTEETKSRALEIGHIVARQIGLDLYRNKIDNISIRVDTNTTADAGDEIVEYWLNGDLVAVGCHDASAGKSYPGPCD